MAAARITEFTAAPTNRHDRAALGVIATYLHELTEHGRPREQDAAPVVELAALGELDDELAEMAGCYACA